MSLLRECRNLFEATDGIVDDVTDTQVQIDGVWYSDRLLPRGASFYKIGDTVSGFGSKKQISNSKQAEKDYDVEVQSDLFRESGANVSTSSDKIERYAEAMDEYGGWGSFPPVYGHVLKVEKEDISRYKDLERRGVESELAWSRPLLSSDVGKKYVRIENGHNRAYAAKKLGIPIKVAVDTTVENEMS